MRQAGRWRGYLKRLFAKERVMQCTAPTSSVSILPAAPVAVSPTSLVAACAAVPDLRRRHDLHYALSAILAMTVAAILANQRSVLAIAEWGGRRRARICGGRSASPMGVPPASRPSNASSSGCVRSQPMLGRDGRMLVALGP